MLVAYRILICVMCVIWCVHNAALDAQMSEKAQRAQHELHDDSVAQAQGNHTYHTYTQKAHTDMHVYVYI